MTPRPGDARAAILAALPGSAPPRQVRLLAALAAIQPGRDGWRTPGSRQLAAAAAMSRTGLRRARGELIAAGLIKYEPGRGRGVRSRWMLLLPAEKGPEKGPKEASSVPLNHREKGPAPGKAPRRRSKPTPASRCPHGRPYGSDGSGCADCIAIDRRRQAPS